MQNGFGHYLANRCLILSIALLISGNLCFGAHKHPEKYYQKQWCDAQGGIMEYKLKDGTRVDCLLPDMAVEFDFAPKWAECIGQALYYGQMTNRTPACVLILENPEKDWEYVRRLRYAICTNRFKEFKILTIKNCV